MNVHNKLTTAIGLLGGIAIVGWCWYQLPESRASRSPSLNFRADKCSLLKSERYIKQARLRRKDWTAKGALVVEALVPVNCAYMIGEGDYRAAGSVLTLKYATYNPRKDKMAQACLCGHRVRYEITGLPKRDYTVEFRKGK